MPASMPPGNRMFFSIEVLYPGSCAMSVPVRGISPPATILAAGDGTDSALVTALVRLFFSARSFNANTDVLKGLASHSIYYPTHNQSKAGPEQGWFYL
jgi:hypothetical protein